MARKLQWHPSTLAHTHDLANSQDSMRQHRTKSPHFQGVTLLGVLVRLNSPVFQAVGQFYILFFLKEPDSQIAVKVLFLEYLAN